MGSLTFDPLISPSLWLLLAAVGVGLFVWYALGRPARVTPSRWATILALSIAGFIAVMIVLLNPTWIISIRPPEGKPTLTLMVDATASMSTQDGPEGANRFQAATAATRSIAQKLANRFDVKIKTFGDRIENVDTDELNKMTPNGESTDLAAAVEAAVATDQPNGQAAVILSDGIQTVGNSQRVIDACRMAKAMACPIFTRTFGGDVEINDLAVELRASQEVGFVGQNVAVSAVVKNRGFVGSTAHVRLSSDGKEIAKKDVKLTASGVVECQFEVGQKQTGLFRYTVRVEPIGNEVNLSNNAALLVLRVVDRPVKVLVLEGKPYWDGKFLVRTLATDPSVELGTVVRVGDDRYLHRTVSRPEGPQANAAKEQWAVLPDPAAVFNAVNSLNGYQVLVLGRDADVFLSDAAIARIQDWVSREGGCLVCYRGSPTNRTNVRLGKLLPVRWTPTPESRFQLKLTPRGQDLRLFPFLAGGLSDDPLQMLPDLALTARPERSKPLTVVLATSTMAANIAANGESEPVLSYQPYGGGRVVVIEGAGMWRWAFLPPQQQRLDDVYRSVWHGMMRWLVSTAELLPGQSQALRTEKVRFGTSESAAVKLIVRDGFAGPIPAVELKGFANGEVRSATPLPLADEPGTYRASFGTLPEGQYEAVLHRAKETDPPESTMFEVRNPSSERYDLKARPDLMARIAETSGGVSLDGKNANDFADLIERQWDSTRPRQMERTPAWDRWWVLAGVVALWATAWGLRRMSGLI